MKRFPLVCFFGLALHSAAVSTPVPLAIHPGSAFDVKYQLSTGQSTSPIHLLITGDLTGDAEFTDGVLSRFRFLGGNIAYSDNTSEAVLSTFPVVAKVRIETRNVVSALTSDTGAGDIDPLTGVLSNTGHFLQQNRGTILTRYIVGGLTLQQELRDLATRPDTNPLVGVTTVTGSLLEDLGYEARYRIDFNHTRDEDRTEPAEVINGTVNITEKGSFTATGEVTVPGEAFVNWALLNRNQRAKTLSEKDAATAQPLVLLYAFDATAGPWVPPVRFRPADGIVLLDLPPGGLRAPLRLEFSSSPTSGQWQLLVRNNNLPSVFNIGEAGTVTMDLPPGDSGFVRLSLAD
jgi:hypothetical protein